MEWLLLILLPSALVIAAGYDVATFTIPNWLCLSIAAVFPAIALIVGLPLASFGLHLAVGAATLALGIMLFAMGLFGGGDAKLMAATALWMGPPAILGFLMATAMIGGALAISILFFRRIPLPAQLLMKSWAVRLHDRGKGIPYGVALAGGGLVAYHAAPVAIFLGAAS
jgi:prepilin peptidase CpaA